jgi:arylformamidase
MWIDLTMPITPDMPNNPVHEPPRFASYARLDEAGWEATRVGLSSHTGTHMDAPSHYIAGAETIEHVRLDLLTGPAQVIHLGAVGERQAIGSAELGPITAPRVLVHTGWSDRTGDRQAYFDRHPYLTEEAADYLVGSGVRLVGIDSPSVDYHPPSPVHLALLGAGTLIVENLVNLARLGPGCEFSVLPLPLAGLDGSPVRAIATSGSERVQPQ